ncbi:MAG: molybdopterin-dependent oxidoreductase [candidate division WOR-3 bacterium]|nr:molybdopterin-dependent oxidoreductase [candidate division WOR-3 bacterium]MCX7946964.1 molybdopterin-dependent oxidoreductase [candidate division WOR-3 bacterium]MDW8149995.1 molybdopterin-dependent oxidoreductase [candidate division WOR-3 bacterium]
MPKIVIDKKEYEFKDGETILEVAWRNNIFIPVFCYHPKMPYVAACRICNVEVRISNSTRIMPACATLCQENMEIITNSNVIKNDIQKGVLELLLLNHPLDCPTCDAGGECDLQELTLRFGSDRSRYEFPKREFERKNFSPFLDLYPNRCIECDRCSRFFHLIGGGTEWGTYNRGWYEVFGVWKKEIIENEFSGNMWEICPLGAINDGSYKFKARPWEIESIESIAPDDSIGSNIYVDIRKKYPKSRGPFEIGGRRTNLFKVYRITSRDNPKVNDYWLSDRERYSYSWINANNRIAYPTIKENGTYRSVNWEYILDAIYSDIKDVNSEEVALITSARSSNESAYLSKILFKEILFTENVGFSEIGEDAIEEVFGYSISNATISDIDDAKNIIIFGDIKNSFPILGIRLIRSSRNGANIFVYNYYKERYILENWAKGIIFHPYEIEKVAYELSLKVKNNEFRGKTVLILPDNLPYRVLRNLLIASIYHDNAKVLILRTKPNKQGFIDVGFKDKSIYEIIEKANLGKIKVLFLWHTDLLLEYPNRSEIESALSKIPIVIYISPFADYSIKYAKYILPETTIFEEDGSRTNTEGRVQIHKQALLNYEDSMPSWWIFKGLIKRFGISLKIDSIEDIRKLMKKEIYYYSEVDFDKRPRYRNYPPFIPSIRKLIKYYEYDLAKYPMRYKNLKLIEPEAKEVKPLVILSPHIYKSSYYASRCEIFYSYIKPYIRTIEANSKTIASLSIDEKFKLEDEEFSIVVNENVVDNVLIYRPLFFDSKINLYLNKYGSREI